MWPLLVHDALSMLYMFVTVSVMLSLSFDGDMTIAQQKQLLNATERNL